MSLSWTKELPHFSVKELMCKGTGIILLDIRFASKLPDTRSKWKKPMTLNSVCRAPSYNTEVGGHPKSLHLTHNPHYKTNGTMAADIRWRDMTSAEKLTFARFLYKEGWSVGLHNGFVHIDLRTELGRPQAVFVYGEWDAPFSKTDVIN